LAPCAQVARIATASSGIAVGCRLPARLPWSRTAAIHLRQLPGSSGIARPATSATMSAWARVRTAAGTRRQAGIALTARTAIASHGIATVGCRMAWRRRRKLATTPCLQQNPGSCGTARPGTWASMSAWARTRIAAVTRRLAPCAQVARIATASSGIAVGCRLPARLPWSRTAAIHLRQLPGSSGIARPATSATMSAWARVRTAAGTRRQAGIALTARTAIASHGIATVGSQWVARAFPSPSSEASFWPREVRRNEFGMIHLWVSYCTGTWMHVSCC